MYPPIQYAGAQILEKHFKIDESMECVDSPVSITELQLKDLVLQTRKIEKILGSQNYIRDCEKGSSCLEENHEKNYSFWLSTNSC